MAMPGMTGSSGMVSMSADMPKKKGPQGGKITGVTIDVADGGFILRLDRDRGDGPYQREEPKVVADLAGLHAALDDAFGAAAPAPPAGPPMPPPEKPGVTVTASEPLPDEMG